MVTANNSVYKILKVAACAGTLSFLLPTVVFAEDAQQVASAETFIQDSKQSYGPIVKSDTLWKIAVANRPDTTVSNYQVMMALFENNPNAFVRKDINTMVMGQFLRIPTIQEIRKIAPYPYQPINQVNVAKSTTEEPVMIANQSIAVPEGQNETELAVKASVAQGNVNTDSESEQLLANNVNNQSQINDSDNLTASADTTDTTDTAIAADTALSESNASGLSNLQVENTELKESLNAVDDQLSYLQYEVAKASEYQTKMDDKLSEQNKLLGEAKQREQRLIAQQRKLSEQQQGFFNNPISYWSINGLLAILVTVLFILVFRRRQVEKSLKAQIAANKSNHTETSNVNTVAVPVAEQKQSNKNQTSTVKDNTIAADSKNHENQSSSMVEQLNVAETENSNVVNAFSSIDLSPVSYDVDAQSPLSEDDLISNLVVKSEAVSISDDEADSQPPTMRRDGVSTSASKDDLNIDQIIDDMLDEDSKPAKLRSARAPQEKLTSNDGQADAVKPDSKAVNTAQENVQTERQADTDVTEFNDFDDVEFDKLLEEISVESQSLPNRSNVTQLRRTNEQAESNVSATKPIAPSTGEVKAADAQDFISVSELIEESENADALDESIHDEHEIDVGLDEFPEFTTNINHVNVDDDKHGVNAKLDLAQVYIEIDDLDNAAVILKSVMKLGNSAQQQQAQQLLYSMK